MQNFNFEESLTFTNFSARISEQNAHPFQNSVLGDYPWDRRVLQEQNLSSLKSSL